MPLDCFASPPSGAKHDEPETAHGRCIPSRRADNSTRVGDEPNPIQVTFASLGLHESILKGVQDVGYEKPTDIQEHAIPMVLQGKDLIGLGQTGSGKTAAFGLPMIHQLVGGEPGLRGLIVVPTRELCVQVAENLRQYCKYTDLKVVTAFGGIDMSIQESAIKRGVDIVVACPGRLIDHLERRNLSLERCQMVVLDEADRMLDMGFMPQIRRIFVRLPQERQNLLFSATMPKEVEDLVENFLPHAERVQIGTRSQAAKTIQHRFVAVNVADKPSVLERLLSQEKGKVLVFSNKKINCEKLGNQLKRAGLPADSIHGDKGAEQRHVVLQAFTRGRTRFLVATDVAARGIDVDDIDLVVNYDFPLGLEDYIHRSGRTGRAGRAGRAISLVAPSEKRLWETVHKHLKGEIQDGGRGGGRQGQPARKPGGGRRPGGSRPGGRGRSRSKAAV